MDIYEFDELKSNLDMVNKIVIMFEFGLDSILWLYIQNRY